jgi:hypothetical protein
MGRRRHPAPGWCMTDAGLIVLTLFFFLLSWLYVRACGRI